MILRFYFSALLCVVVSCVIFPNSLKVTAGISLAVAFLCAVPRVKNDAGLRMMLASWLLTSLVTLSYILVGLVKGAPTEAGIQVFLIYMVFPFVWVYVIELLLEQVALAAVISGLIVSGIAACLTVFFFYYSFLNVGPESVEFFIEAPNVDVSTEGYIGATMYVFGSLIFIVGGYIASYSSLSGRLKSGLLLALFVFVALISGRGALILSVFIGFGINLIVLVKNGKKPKPLGILWIVLSGLTLTASLYYFDLSLERILNPLLEKMVSVGGEGRNQQFFALIDGIVEHAGLGAGHGVSVDYRVNDIYPWRYEMVWLASVFRVGIIGAIIYALPFVVALLVGFRRLFKRDLDANELFLFGGFVSAFVASNTNPYLEALVFQWMFILPTLYFAKGIKYWRLREDAPARSVQAGYVNK